MWVDLLRFGNRLLGRRCIWTGQPLKTATKESAEVASTSTQDKANAAVKDIVMFRYENPTFFRFLNLFAITQFGFWAVLSTTSLTMISTPVEEKKKDPDSSDNNQSKSVEETEPFWRRINLGSNQYKYGLCVGSFLMGYGILFVSWTYITRSVRYLILRKNGKTVSFVTYGPFGRNRIMDVPLNNVSAAGSRFSDTTQMPVKVKGKHLYYILDLKDGQFPQPKLFDQTVGLKRKI